ncbi:MAG: protein kinase [Dehalococcoidia bacterium]|jgi:serine/threonine protein kinase|nr:protein kinase [Dehalococcoidia bacterium]
MAEEYIGRYQIIETIASGSQGAVHRAFDPQLNRIVALKVLLPALISQTQHLERFRREATLMSAIDHPNVVKILDVGSDGDTHYLAMELLPESLSRIIETSRQLPIENAVRFAIQVADGLAAVHDAGIIHRDIKPQNILIDAEGVAKVTDFGIARGDMLGTLTATGVMMGTPYYMSPEQAAGGGVDARSDIYALGGVLYQMLAGEVVFNATTPLAILRLHIDEPPRPVESLRADVPAAVSGIVMRALAKRSEERFESADDMAEALRAAMPGVAESAPVVRTPRDVPTTQHSSHQQDTRQPAEESPPHPPEPLESTPVPEIGSDRVRASQRRALPLGWIAMALAIVTIPVMALMSFELISSTGGSSTSPSLAPTPFPVEATPTTNQLREPVATTVPSEQAIPTSLPVPASVPTPPSPPPTPTPVPIFVQPSAPLHNLGSVPTGVIVSVAGVSPLSSGPSIGDGGIATAAKLSSPFGVTVGSDGTVYIADSRNNRVRRVDPLTGVILTVAGTGTNGYSGDGGSAVAAMLNFSGDVAIDNDGNLYIADSGNSRIRHLDATSGIISTIAGNGTPGFSGDGGPAFEAQLNGPGALTLDTEGHLYFADSSNHRIRRVDARTRVITTVAGSGGSEDGGDDGDDGLATEAQIPYPDSVSVDTGGNLYVVTSRQDRVRRVDAATGIITTIAGTGESRYSGDGGPAIEAPLMGARGVLVDAEGNLYIADAWNYRVRRVDAGTGIIITIAGNGIRGYDGDGGLATEAQLDFPTGMSLDTEGNLYIADTYNDRIRRVDAATGIITTIAGTDDVVNNTGDGGLATATKLTYPVGISVSPAGDLYISNLEDPRVLRVDANTGVISSVVGNGDSGYGGDGGPANQAQLDNPIGVSVGNDGNLFIADTGNHRVRHVHGETGVVTTVAGTGEPGYRGDGGPAT